MSFKVEIDLNDILGDECGAETLEDSIRRQVIEKISGEIKSGISKKIDIAVAEIINTTLKEEVGKRLPEFFEGLMSQEYFPVDRYGDHSKTSTTFKKEVLRTIQESMVYKKNSNGYSNELNIFTRTVDDFLKETVAGLQKEWRETLDKKLAEESLKAAVTYIKNKLGINLSEG